MNLDYATLDALRRNHPGWRLLLADSAPLIVSFLHRVFVAPNVRVMAQADLVEKLEDELYALRQTLGAEAFTARDLLSDFREVEHNFRVLDRRVRERIALWEGAKGALLDEILGERDAIADSDQGRSFRAFWDFLMSQAKQEELSALLDRVMQLPAVTTLQPDSRIRRVHYDWLTAGEHTQRTVALLSQQLRRFLDDQAWLENRRIMEILHGIESHALGLRDSPPAGDFMAIDDTAVSVALPLERPLFSPPLKTAIATQTLEAGEEEFDADVLFSQVVIDKAQLGGRIRQALQLQPQITLREVVETHPLEHGLAELVTYLTLAGDDRKAVFDETTLDRIRWQDRQGGWKMAELLRVIFVR